MMTDYERSMTIIEAMKACTEINKNMYEAGLFTKEEYKEKMAQIANNLVNVAKEANSTKRM